MSDGSSSAAQTARSGYTERWPLGDIQELRRGYVQAKAELASERLIGALKAIRDGRFEDFYALTGEAESHLGRARVEILKGDLA